MPRIGAVELGAEMKRASLVILSFGVGWFVMLMALLHDTQAPKHTGDPEHIYQCGEIHGYLQLFEAQGDSLRVNQLRQIAKDEKCYKVNPSDFPVGGTR